MREFPDRPRECEAARIRARDAIVETPGGALPPEAEEHFAGCPECRAEIESWTRLDGMLASALGSLRLGIRGLGRDDIDRILSAVREPSPEALLLGKIRRSVKRMLFLTILVLSFLAVAGIAWALILAWKATHG